MKTFKGKAIYTAGGPAAEYGKYGCGFYVGCPNGCTYCYLQKPPFKKACGSNVPTLKKHFKDENHALEVFEKEFRMNFPEIRKHGLFFSFTTDPMLLETIALTTKAVILCVKNDIPVKILTKMTDWFIPVTEDYHGENLYKVIWGELMYEVMLCGCEFYFEFGCDSEDADDLFYKIKNYIAFGFTLTGHDELEPNASTNAERIETMRKLHEAGFKTWASIEPVIDFESSLRVIEDSLGYADLYKIGLESGKEYDKLILRIFTEKIICMKTNNSIPKLYFKDSLLKQAGINREDLPNNCAGRDYNMFNS
jgi:DNA repair photolyase